MAKSARASAVKKNKSKLKSKVFGPVEQARAERLSQKLLQLAQQAKPREAAKMAVGDVEVEEGGNDEVEESAAAEMDVDGQEASKAQSASRTSLKKARDEKKTRIEKKRRRKETNRIAFKPHPMKAKKGRKG